VAGVEIMTPSMLERMRVACQMAAECLVMVGEHIRPGITTEDINKLVHEFTLAQNAYPAPLQYKGFPKSVCTSVNECVCHGIPGPRTLVDGDIVNVDVTTLFPAQNGYHGDTSATFYVGEPSEEAKWVTETSRRCLEIGIAQVKHGARIGDIGAAIEAYAKSRGCEVVRDYVGHGVGRKFHTEPQVPHYGRAGTGKRIKAGMVFTIEPMINLGGYETELQDDDWTVLTADRSLSAQFEHTLVVTRDGCEVLTQRDRVLKGSEDKPWADVGPLSAPAACAVRASAPAEGLREGAR
jgi:methionyl aminopeptidase